MNFVISHEQTSQSGTNPVILLPDLSDRGRRRWRPGSAEAQPLPRNLRRGGGAAAGPRCPAAPPPPGSACPAAEHGHQLRGLSYTSPDNQRWREAGGFDGLGSSRGCLRLSCGVTSVGPRRGDTARIAAERCGTQPASLRRGSRGGWVSGFCGHFSIPKYSF